MHDRPCKKGKSMPRKALIAIFAILAANASAESAQRFQILGEIAPSCDSANTSIPLVLDAGGFLAGQTAYNCNAPHFVAFDLGVVFAGALIKFEGVEVMANAQGVATVYRSSPHFGSTTLRVQSSQNEQLGTIRVMLQPA
ncbi:MAG: hypothetical protein RLO80_07360 [Hyphomonas sp.]